MFVEEIRKSFPGCTPIGWRLRNDFHNSWFRIHSLPESKRYAESETEYSILLHRNNEIATDVLGEKSEIVIFWYRYDEKVSSRPEFCLRDYEDDHNIFAKEAVWSRGGHDQLIKDVADENEPSVVLFSMKTGNAYSPYDGGADLYLKDASSVSALKEKYKSWLPLNDSGL